MNSGADPRRAALSRVLADAVRAAWGRDGVRARRLLRLADRIAAQEHRKQLLVAAESVRSALASSPGAEGDVGGSPATRRGTGGSPVAPRLRLPPGTDLRNLVSQELPLAASPVTMPVRSAGGRAVRSSRHARPRRRGVGVVFVGVLVGCVAWAGGGTLVWGEAASARRLLTEGRAAEARERLHSAKDAEGLRLRAEAGLLLGDTASAVADLVAAARADRVPGEGAWAAARRLEQLPGAVAATAEAYRFAYAAGIPAERWEHVANALERAGRAEEAARVRAGVSR